MFSHGSFHSKLLEIMFSHGSFHSLLLLFYYSHMAHFISFIILLYYLLFGWVASECENLEDFFTHTYGDYKTLIQYVRLEHDRILEHEHDMIEHDMIE